MPTTVPAWFNADFYATQKVAQMNATAYEMGEGGWLADQGATAWTPALYNQYLGQYTTPDGASVTPWQNFEACNAPSYAGNADVTLADINVSPNQYFDVEVYLQNLASYNNANPGAYAGTAPEGGWTVANELSEIFNQYKMSVWEHYRANWHQVLNDASTTLNPSNAFDTQVYLAARAEAANMTVADLIDQLVKDGKSPIEDYFENGQAITIQPVTTPVTPVLPDGTWTVWGEPVTPPAEVDPFDQDVTHVNVKADQLAYPAEGETYTGNTQFDAAWVQSTAGSTLNAKDTFTGPEGAYNTLAINMGKDWKGFAEQKDADGNVIPSVQNVGRVVLERGTGTNVEAQRKFDAAGISEDAYRFDLRSGDGPGAYELSNLSNGVTEVRLSDITPKDAGSHTTPGVTKLAWAKGAKTAKDDALTIQLDNVGAAGAGKAAGIESSGIEELTLHTIKNDDSYVDLGDFKGVKTLKFTGEGNVTVTDVDTTIRTYDASAATGNVNMALNNPSNTATSVIGGKGTDTVTLTSGTWTPASLESIENIALTDGATVNLKNVGAGVNTLNTDNGTIKGLTADNFTVNLTSKTALNTATVNGDDGSLQNIIFKTADLDKPGTISANLSTNATGQVTLQGGENVALSAGSLVANNATALEINATSIDIGGASSAKLGALQDLTINLEGTASSLFKAEDLVSIQNVTINGNGEDFNFAADLGDLKKDEASITLDVNEVGSFSVGDIETSLGCNIDVDIEATGSVTLGNLIKTDTNATNNDEGNVKIIVTDAAKVESEGASGINIYGGDITVDINTVSGDGINGGVVIHSKESISYQGAGGQDIVLITEVGEGTINNINLGGADAASANIFGVGNNAARLEIENGGQATFNVDFGEGANRLLFNTAKGFATVYIKNYGDDDLLTAGYGTLGNTDSAFVNSALSKFGLTFSVDADDAVNIGTVASPYYGWVHEGSTYIVQTDPLYPGVSGAGSTLVGGTVIVLEDWVPSA